MSTIVRMNHHAAPHPHPRPHTAPPAGSAHHHDAHKRILFIDIDGTMVGNVAHLVCEWDLVNTFERTKARALKASIVDRLRFGILRPYLDQFLKHLPAKTPVFVYTASDKVWAGFLVSCIEQALDFKFQRPIFSRVHCTSVDGEYKKSLRRVLPIARRSLGLRPDDPSARGLLIDNTPSVLPADEARDALVVCPTYDFAYYYDVLGNLSASVVHAKFPRIIATLKKNKAFPETIDSDRITFMQFMYIYHEHLSRALRYVYRKNIEQLKRDQFWLHAAKQALVR